MRQALLKWGLPLKLYLDNGPAFRSHHLEEITASQGTAPVHSPPHVPQGRARRKILPYRQVPIFPRFRGLYPSGHK
ncbi:hypothetical protein DFAR_2090028 [Desulfarculales bacterium]